MKARRRAFRIVLAAVAAFALANLVYAVALDCGPASVRDPEYGYRLTSLCQRHREHPDRPLVVVVGSSRTAQGVRPDVYEAARTDPAAPLLFNLSQSGGGPLLQLFTLRRLLADGVVPDTVLFEVWPPLLRGDGSHAEQLRIVPTRLRAVDEPTVREFFTDPDAAWRARHGDCLLPLVGRRREVINRSFPTYLPDADRSDFTWKDVDGWGWWPGRMTTTREQADAGWPDVEAYYRPLFADFTVGEVNDRALRACIELCRDRGIAVVLARLPESTRFQTLKTGDAVRVGEEYIAAVKAEYGLPLIDARDWADDAHLPDGFHLTRDGAAAFTRRLGEHVPRPGTRLQPTPSDPAPSGRP